MVRRCRLFSDVLPKKLIVQPCLHLSIRHPRDGIVATEVFASNGRFSASSSLTASLAELSQFVEEIRGFPRSTDQEAQLTLGSQRDHPDDFAGGYCSVRAYCANGRGEIGIDVALEDDDYGNLAGRADFTMRTLPTEIDRFVTQFERAVRDGSGVANLNGIGEQAEDGDTLQRPC